MLEQQMLRNQEQMPEELGGGGYSDPRAAYSPRLKEFREAIGLLYIRNNISGRIKFRLKWPEVAQFLFGDELIAMDNDGTQDRDLRAKLENEAGLRRIALKAIMEEFEDKSVKSGSLEFEYVGSVLDKVGSDVGKLLYAENIIERVRPGLLAKTQQSATDKTKAANDAQELKDDVLRARSASMAQEGEHFDPVFSEQELAEKSLAEQERQALQMQDNPAPPQAASPRSAVPDLGDLSEFKSMKIEIGEDVKPIDLSPPPEVLPEPPQDVVQEVAPAEVPVMPQELPPEPIAPPQVTQEAQVPTETTVSEAPLPPMPPLSSEGEKKPRLHIAGLRIKDEPSPQGDGGQSEGGQS